MIFGVCGSIVLSFRDFYFGGYLRFESLRTWGLGVNLASTTSCLFVTLQRQILRLGFLPTLKIRFLCLLSGDVKSKGSLFLWCCGFHSPCWSSEPLSGLL